jgi:DNA-binding transcriptional LysR family regulator
VAPLLADFLVRHPEVRGELVLADRLVGLVEEEVDLAVRIGVLDDSSLRARPVGATRRVLVASPAYLATHRPPRTPEALARHLLIQQAAMTPGREWRFVSRGRERRVEVQPAYVSNDAEAARVLAERGLGVAMLLGYQVLDQVRAGRLQVVLPGFEPPPLPIQLVHPGARHPSANVRAFVDFVVAHSRWQFVEM